MSERQTTVRIERDSNVPTLQRDESYWQISHSVFVYSSQEIRKVRAVHHSETMKLHPK